MANFYLDKDQTSEIGGSKVTVNGTDGTQDRILLLASARDAVVTESVETADFAGSLAAYTFHAVGGGVGVYRDGALVATVVPNAKTPTELRFAEGGITVDQDADTGAYTVGGWTVPGGDDTDPEAWAGEETAVNPEHKSEAGTLGPAGKGIDYNLPQDFQPGNVINSDALSNTYTTEMNGLKASAQIVDASIEDDDVLVLNYNALNLNGQIVNVETIQAKWDGLTDGEFDANKVISAAQGGTNIVVSANRSVSKNFVVDNAKGNSVTAGDGVEVLTVAGIKGGGVIDAGKAGRVALEGTGATTVKADHSIALNLGGFTTSKSKALTIESDKAITVSADGVNTGDYIQAAGRGDITLGTSLGAGDISNMTGFKAIGVTASGVAATYTVANGQTVLFSDGSGDNGANFVTDGKAGNLNVELNLIANDRDLGALSIADGGTDPRKNQISKLAVDTNGHDLVIADIVTDGSDGKLGSKEPGNDTVSFAGANSVTLKDVSSGGIIDASQLGGRLTVGDKDNAVDVQDAEGKSLAIAAGEGGSDVTIGTVGKGLFFFQGGSGADKVTFTGKLDGSNRINSSATLDMGAGDDTVVIDATAIPSGNIMINQPVRLDFGAGEKDTLQVKGKGIVDFKGSIAGLNVLNIADGAQLRMDDKAFGSSNGVIAPTFTLQSNGLILNHTSGTLDLSGITPESDSVRPEVRVMVKQDAGPAGTVVCTNGLTEIIEIKGAPARPSDMVTIKGFTAGSADRIQFANADKAGTPLKFDNGDFHADAKSLADVKPATGEYALWKDGTDTYVVANIGGDRSVVRLEGTAYTTTLLSGSVTPEVVQPTGEPGTPVVTPDKDFDKDNIDKKSGLVAGLDGANNSFDFGTDGITADDNITASQVTVDGSKSASNVVALGNNTVKPVTILGCDGTDNVTVGDVGKDVTAHLGDGGNDVRVTGDVASGVKVDVTGGADNDVITLGAGKTVSGTVTADLGDGSNTANLNASINPTATVTITGGAGKDEVKAGTIDVEGTLNINLGGGKDNEADLSSATIKNGTTTVTGGEEADKVSGGTVSGGTLKISTGLGADEITFTTIDSGTLDISAGNGDDKVILGTITSGTVKLAGGLGDDTLVLESGSMSGDLTTNFLDSVSTLTGFEILDLNGISDSAASGGEFDTGKLNDVTTVVGGTLEISEVTSSAALGQISQVGLEGSNTVVNVTAKASTKMTLDVSGINVASSSTLNISGGSGDAVTIGAVKDGTVTYTGSSEADTVTLTSADITGTLTLSGGAGNDVLQLGSGVTLKDLTATQKENAGFTHNGFTVLGLSGDTTVSDGDLAFTSGSGNITAFSGGDLTINVEKGGTDFALGGITTVSGSKLTINVGANATSFSLSGITASGGASDVVTVDASEALKTGTTITLSGIKDVITLNGATAGSYGSMLTLASFSGGTGGDQITGGTVASIKSVGGGVTINSVAEGIAEALKVDTTAAGRNAVSFSYDGAIYYLIGTAADVDGMSTTFTLGAGDGNDATIVKMTGITGTIDTSNFVA